MKTTSPAARKSAPNKTAQYWLAGYICLALLLFGPHFTLTNPWQGVFEPVQAVAQNRTGFDLDAFREEFDKDGDGEVDAPDEADAQQDVSDQPDEVADDPSEEEADDGPDDRDDEDEDSLVFENDGEEDAPDHAIVDADRDGDGDGKYDLDEAEVPDFAGHSRTVRTSRSRPAPLKSLGLLSELTPLPSK